MTQMVQVFKANRMSFQLPNQNHQSTEVNSSTDNNWGKITNWHHPVFIHRLPMEGTSNYCYGNSQRQKKVETQVTQTQIL